MEHVRVKKLNEIPGLELFIDYSVDANGNVWSFKYNRPRKLKPGWAKKKGDYLFVRLTDRRGNQKNFYVHRLVAMAYLPCNDLSDHAYEVNHLNDDLCDNRLENLEWIKKKEKIQQTPETRGLVILNDYLSNKIKTIHAASVRKGLIVPNVNDFINNVIETALEQHINQYGLRKIMKAME